MRKRSLALVRVPEAWEVVVLVLLLLVVVAALFGAPAAPTTTDEAEPIGPPFHLLLGG